MDAFLSQLDGLKPKTGDSIIKAINYTNACRPYLKSYLQDRAIASTVVFSLVKTAKANGMEWIRLGISYLSS